MKILAETPSGGSIVEFSKQETELILSLQSCMNSNGWQPKVPRNYPIEGNMEKAFLAVIWFVDTKFAINNLRNLADELDEAIGVKSNE